MKLLLTLALVQGILLAFIYSSSLQYPLLQSWDDPEYVTLNPSIYALDAHHIKRIFSSFTMGNYAPIHILSYAIDVRLFGPGPAGFRITNLLIHFLNAILVFYLIRRINGNKWIALLVSVFFAIHPLQVESVAWVSQRKSVLSTLFLLSAFLTYAEYSERNRLHGYWISVFLISLGLLTKISVVIFPAYIAAYDLLVLQKRPSLKNSWKYVPFILVSLTAGLITLKSQSVGGIRPGYYVESLMDSVPVVPTLWLTYLSQILLPLNLSALYDEKIIVGFSFTRTMLVLLFLVVMIFSVFRWLKDGRRTTLFWLIWAIVGLLPVSHIIPMVTIMNDRYLYFPVIGIFALLGHGSEALFQSCGLATLRSFANVLFVIVAVLFALLAFERVQVWGHDLTLWTDAVSKFPKQAKARNNLGTHYLHIGEYGKALAEFKEALEIDPNLYVARLNLGSCYLKLRKYPSAEKELQKAMAIFDGDPKAHYYLGMALYYSGQSEQAIHELRWVVDRFPNWGEVVLNLIRAYKDANRNSEAIELIDQARERFRNDISVLSQIPRLANDPTD